MNIREMNFQIHSNPHNELEGLARYHINVIEGKLATGECEGIALDCMSAAIATAFFNEAVINFVGLQILDKNWNETVSFVKKINALATRLKFKFDCNIEPFYTVDVLQKTRNSLAHGKPTEFKCRTASKEELALQMRPTSQTINNPRTVVTFFEQSLAFKELLMQKAAIKYSKTLSSAAGVGSMKIVR